MEKHKQIPRQISRYWLLLGVFALAVAGLYSLTLVMGRAPIVSNNPELQRIFKDALVVHVDLSVLIWFLSVACMFWSRLTAAGRSFIPYIEEAALICFALTILCMMASPFDPKAQALMSNYIPAISSPLFVLSLGFLLSGVGLMLFKTLTQAAPKTPLEYGVISSAYIALISVCAFIWSYHLMPRVIEGEQYFDMVFWGGGHVLQLAHTQIIMVVWLMLAAQFSPARVLKPTLLYVLFSLGLVAALASPAAYFFYDVASMQFRQFFTHNMIAASGVAPGILALVMLGWLVRDKNVRKGGQRALWSCALVSVLLFLYGGFLGLLIHGQNVVIPAHYHGSIVGITIGFMGIAYYMLPQFGYRSVSATKLAYWQPIVLGIGQIMHVSGLAYSGGYGVLRKTAGGIDTLAPNIKIALGFMGMGGMLAIIGGLMFVIVVAKSVYKA